MKRIQIISLIASIGLFSIVFELVRRKKLKERFSILWILFALLLVVFSLWSDLLENFSQLIGIYYAPAVLIPVITFFGVVLFLYFSIVVTHQAEKIKTIAQKIALLEHDLLELKSKLDNEKKS